MINKPKVSILVIFHNQEHFVDKALSSIMSQKTNFEFEVLIGDDNSTDNTIYKINKWIDKFPNQISLYKSSCPDKITVGGFRASRNRLNLIKNVQGEYFIFLDGDDYYLNNNKIQKQVDKLDNPKNSDCIACAHDILYVYPNGETNSLRYKIKEEVKLTKEEYWDKFYFHTDTLLCRSNIIESIPADLVNNTYNDQIITFIAIQHGKLLHISKEYSAYYQNPKGIWVGSKKINNCLREMMGYDVTLAINKSMAFISLKKFWDSYVYLWRNRKVININEYRELYKEAKSKNFKTTMRWFSVNEKWYCKLLLWIILVCTYLKIRLLNILKKNNKLMII